MTATSSPAYAFESDLDLASMLEALNRAGTISWRLADSDSHGDYLGARLRDRQTRLRIFSRDGKYILDVRWIAALPGAMTKEEVDTVVQRDVLAVVGARSVTPRASWD